MNSLINNGRKFKSFVECQKCVKSLSFLCLRKNSFLSSRRNSKYSPITHDGSNFKLTSRSLRSLINLRWFSTPECLSSSLPRSDFVADDILSMKSCNDVLNYIESSDPKNITCNHTWLAVNHIMRIHYKSLWESNTWLHSNLHVAHIQLILEQRMEECFKVYLDHPSFPKFKKLLLDQYMMMDPSNLSEALLSFVYMGMPFDDVLIYKYLTRINNEIESLSLSSLETLSNVVRSLPGFQYAINRSLLKQTKSFMENNPSPTIDELSQLANIIINSIKFIGEDFSFFTLDYFQKCLLNMDFSGKPEMISCLMRMAQTFFQVQPTIRNEVSELVNVLVKICSDNVQQLHGPSIAEICRSLKLMRCYKGDIARLMVLRASELLDETNRVSEISNLMSSLNKHSFNSTVKKFEKHLYQKMSDSDSYFDVILISNIADSLLDLSKIDSELLGLFHKLVSKQANNIVAYLSRFNRVSRLLAIHSFTDPEDEKNFVQIVAKYVDSIYGINIYTLSFMGVYLLSLNNHDCIPVHVYQRLISSLPNWNVPELSRLLGYLNNFKFSEQSFEQRQRHLNLIRNLQQIIVNKLSSLNSLDSLFSTTVSVVVNSKLNNPSITEHVMNCFIPFSKDLNSISTGKLAKLLSLTSCYMPDICQRLINYTIQNGEKMTSENIGMVLATCAKLGHRPEQMDKFCEVVRRVYDDDLKNGNYKSCLLTLNNLALIQHFPEDLLQNFFSLNTIENLEHFIEESGDRLAEHTLMNLNRSVILECPHLDIPWFNEQYCIDVLSKSRSRNRHKTNMADDIYQVLSQMFKGSHYARVDTFSRYFYRIDCELGLDNNSRPIPANIWDSAFNNAIQRVAFCIWHESSYCRNSKHLMGHENLRKRHLELLNYKIVEVPHYEWYSMGLLENSMKMKYLDNKLKQLKI